MCINFNRYFLVKIALSALFCFALAVSSFKSGDDIHFLATQTQLKLNACHDQERDVLKAKKYEILVTDDGFLRYRKFFSTGKQEYYSFNLRRLNSVDYLGTISEGDLVLKSLGGDVIVQTYTDPKGNIDSMATVLNLNLKAIEPEDLNLIQNNLLQMKKMLQLN